MAERTLYWTELRIFLESRGLSRSITPRMNLAYLTHSRSRSATPQIEMGTTLLDAGARGVILTPAGSRLARALGTN